MEERNRRLLLEKNMFESMRKESNRLKTFQMYPQWPKDYVDIKKLAKAGFFYLFSGDNVCCAFCRGQVCRWDRDDDPMSEHARHFSSCPFIMGGEVGNEFLGEDPIPGPKRPRPYDVCGPFPSFPPNDPRSEADQISMNTYEQTELQRREESSRHQVSSQEAQFQSSRESHISNSLNDQNNNIQRQLLQQPVLGRDSRLNSFQDLYTTHVHANQNYSAQQANLVASDQTSQSSEAVTPNSLTGICKICYTNSIELVFLPCGHSVSCLSCAQRLFNCPCCREIITTRIRTYLV